VWHSNTQSELALMSAAAHNTTVTQRQHQNAVAPHPTRLGSMSTQPRTMASRSACDTSCCQLPTCVGVDHLVVGALHYVAGNATLAMQPVGSCADRRHTEEAPSPPLRGAGEAAGSAARCWACSPQTLGKRCTHPPSSAGAQSPAPCLPAARCGGWG
jgi:hypothetical protein